MPKTRKQKKHTLKSYTRVTHRSLDKFKQFKSEDDTNLTKTYRDMQDYSHQLKFRSNLAEFIIELAKEKGRKIRILDSGCGQCVMVDMLLTNAELSPYIEQVVGVSLHYFENAKKVMETHSKRFHYYLGKVQDVLAKAVETHQKFDLILDMWGAYPYSSDKIELLEQYHHALSPHGKAYIYNPCKDISLSSKTEEKPIQFFDWAIKKYPETFSRQTRTTTFTRKDAKQYTIVLTKSSLRFPAIEFKTTSSTAAPSIGKWADFLPQATLKKGNALFFKKTAATEVSDQSSKLRPLPFERKM